MKLRTLLMMSANGSKEERGRSERDDNESSGYWMGGALAAAGVAALAGGVYWLTSGKLPQVQADRRQQQKNTQKKALPPPPAPGRPATEDNSVSSYLTNFLNRMATSSSVSAKGGKFSNSPPPENPCISNLNGLLDDIFVRYVQIKNADFQLHYKVFDSIFQHLHQKMKDVDPYYRKYSSTVQFAGSHYDNLRIKKPDEFDMDIVIDLPLNLSENAINATNSDIFIEPKAAGYVQLKMGVQFQNLPKRDGIEWLNNRAAYEWMDSTKYLLRSKFLDWFKSVVNKGLNQFDCSGSVPVYYLNGVPYSIGKSESGPAMTLIIENKSRGFKLDVDLVPALKFPESRWPIGRSYRSIPARCARGSWLVVGKSIGNGAPHDHARSWRLALHNQERELMHDTGNLRQAVRLLKKLRDSLRMDKVASYYVKTLFFWEIVERNDKTFWQKNNPAFLFKLMVAKLHAALVNRKIPYFWNKGNNLIANVDEKTLFEYAAKLVPLMQVLENPKEYKLVAKYLLTAVEFNDYNEKFLHI